MTYSDGRWRVLLRAKGEPVHETAVDLDGSLVQDCDGRQLTGDQELAATVHVLRARADDLRGPRSGSRALILALRGVELEQQLLDSCGLEGGADALREMQDHPATLAAVGRWRHAQQLSRQLLAGDG